MSRAAPFPPPRAHHSMLLLLICSERYPLKVALFCWRYDDDDLIASSGKFVVRNADANRDVRHVGWSLVLARQIGLSGGNVEHMLYMERNV